MVGSSRRREHGQNNGFKQQFSNKNLILEMNLAQTNIPEWSKGSDLRSDASASRVRIPLLVHNPGQTVSTALTELVSITGRITGSTVRRWLLTVRTRAFEACNSGSNPDNAYKIL